MADAMSRMTSGRTIGVFTMQSGPGTENSFGGVAQAYADSVPVFIQAAGHERHLNSVPPNFSALVNYRNITKWIEQVNLPTQIPNAMSRAFTQVRNGRPRPVLVEIPWDVYEEQIPEPTGYVPAVRVRTAPIRPGSGPRRRSSQRPSGRSSTPARASTTPRRGRSSWRSPSCSRRRSPRASRARARSRDASALAGLRRPGGAEAGPPFPRPLRCDLRHRLLLRGHRLRRGDAGRQDGGPRDARPGGPQPQRPRRPCAAG